MTLNQREQGTLHQPPPLPIKFHIQGHGVGVAQQRAGPFAALSNEADLSLAPYKPVPAPKPLANPPPYRQPPLPSNLAQQVQGTSSVQSQFNKSESALFDPSEQELLAYSSKFPTDRELIVSTNDKIAEVSRIDSHPEPVSSQGGNLNAPHQETDAVMQPLLAQPVWNDEMRNARNGENLALVSVPQSGHFPEGIDNAGMEQMHRPASYMPMHIHYTGWGQENNYLPMGYDSRMNGNNSLQFDTMNPTHHRDPFTPSNQALSQYEIHVQNTERPSNVSVAPWPNSDTGDSSTFDRLRDTCNKMFVRTGNLQGSGQIALSPTTTRASHVHPTESQSTVQRSSAVEDANSGLPEQDKTIEKDVENKAGSLRKKFGGRTYHHIKDIITTKFGKSNQQKSKTNEVEDNREMEKKTIVPEESVLAVNQSVDRNEEHRQSMRQVDNVHSLNQRIHSQLTSRNQVWGSYGRSNGAEGNATLTDLDTSALAKLSLTSGQENEETKPTLNSPFAMRHKPSVTFRMDLNECQYKSMENGDSMSYYPYGRTTQGQVILYDDTMHFPQQGNDPKRTASEHDSSMSSITSPLPQGQAKRSAFTYSDYDIPPKTMPYNSTASPHEGSSSGHQSAGSSSDVEKRSGQSLTASDSGLEVKDNAPTTSRSRCPVYQGVLDTSTESDVFLARQNKSDWSNSGDREVACVMEMVPKMNEQISGIQCTTPPLPPLSSDNSPVVSPKLKHKFSSSKPDLLEPTNPAASINQRADGKSAVKSFNGGAIHRSGSVGQNVLFNKMAASIPQPSNGRKVEEKRSESKKPVPFAKPKAASKSIASMQPLTALQKALDLGEITSTTTGLDLDGDSDSSSSQDDGDDLSTTMDMGDSRTIRRQLEGLETMYSEVLKALHKKSCRPGGANGMGEYKLSKRRMYGSVSSLPSSVSSRPVYRDRRRNDDRRRSKDLKAVNKRFQRLESHVVTLARSVAHLSSEMRTQHIVIQEMETIRNEIAQLRASPLRLPPTGPSLGAGKSLRADWNTCWQGAVPALTDPCRVKKLTSFFGDEPPLMRIFLKKLGYEKYAPLFDQERIGMIELPYLTEERLQKMGIPMGPRIRILQEAQLSNRLDNINVYGVV